MTKTATKQCGTCKEPKALDDFHKDKSQADGKTRDCKQCLKLRATRNAIKRKKKGRSLKKKKKATAETETEGLAPGVANWDQAGSWVREMAELQAFINTENAECENRLNLIKKDSDERLDPYISRQELLQKTLKAFVNRTCRNRIKKVRHFRFGDVSFNRRRVEVVLRPELAAKMRGQP